MSKATVLTVTGDTFKIDIGRYRNPKFQDTLETLFVKGKGNLTFTSDDGTKTTFSVKHIVSVTMPPLEK